MKLDDTLLKIFVTIQQEVKEKFNVELSVQELFEVVNTQIEATKLGFSKGVTVYWERFCKFAYTERSTTRKDLKKVKQILAEQDHLTAQEKEEILRSSIIEKAKRKKALIKNSSGLSKKESLDTVLNAPTITNVKMLLFKNITKKK